VFPRIGETSRAKVDQVGVEDFQEVSDISLHEFTRFWEVNVKGTLLCVRGASSMMKKQDFRTIPGRTTERQVGRGVIINLGSCNSYMATERIVQYTSAKHAVMGMTKNAGTPSPSFRTRLRHG
jgi:NAD(P)-dependent dehydrogenase (short-subunit alcohol dehydrogenase family)